MKGPASSSFQITMRFVVAEGCRLEGQEQGSNPISAGVLTAPNCRSRNSLIVCCRHMQLTGPHLGTCRSPAPAMYMSQQSTAGSTICLAQHSMASQTAAAACL